MKRTSLALVVTAGIGYLIAVALAVVVIARDLPTNAQGASPICDDQPDGSFVNNPINCRSYWLCSGGTAHALECPNNWNFNPNILICQKPTVFACEDEVTEAPPPATTTPPPATTTPPPPPATTTPPPATTTPPPVATTPPPQTIDQPFSCPATGVSFHAIPHSCSSYRLCFMGVPQIRDCAANTLFDERLLQCNFRRLVDCRGRCPAVSTPTELIMFPSHLRCDEYFICYHGQAVSVLCAPGLHWNPSTETCEVASGDQGCDLVGTVDLLA